MEPLGPQGVHVWSVDLDVPPERLAALESSLAEPERERAARFHFRRDRERFAAARGSLLNPRRSSMSLFLESCVINEQV